jgi:hypothetical protein
MQASNTSSSIQDPSDLVSLPAVELIELGQTEIDVEDVGALEALTDFPDVTFERIDLPDVSDLPIEQAERDIVAPIAAADRFEVPRPPPDWCVDQGATIVAMTTFELWMALARGDMDSHTRVWGNGMDNWEIVADVPDLAHALTDTFSLAPPPPVISTPNEIMSSRGDDRTPLGFGTTDVANDDLPAQSGPISHRRKVFSFGRVMFAAACLAAAAAVGLTLVPRTFDSSDVAAAANGPLAVAPLHGAMERANRRVDNAVHRRLEAEAARAVEPVIPSARKHKEIGQRRSRHGRH